MKVKFTLIALLLTGSLSVFAQSELVAKYLFENNLENALNPAILGEALTQASGTLPAFEENTERQSVVLHQYFGFNDAATTSYVKFDNPLRGVENLSGATISLWVNRLDANVWDAIWSFSYEEDVLDDIVKRCLYLTPNAYLGFNGTGGWFDCNWPDNVTNAIAVNEWNMVTVTLDATGFSIYINGEKRYDKTQQLAWNSNDAIAPADFNYSHLINLIKSSAFFYLGYGSWWGSAALLDDDLLIYNGALTDAEVAALYDAYVNGTGIETAASKINVAYDAQAKIISITGLDGNEKVELINLMGQKIKVIHSSSIYTGNINPGIYLLNINNGKSSKIQKILIR
jgi:arabinan endo-1,5-alpha-L-arabinosidase